MSEKREDFINRLLETFTKQDLAGMYYQSYDREQELIAENTALKKSPYKCDPNCFNYKVKQELEKRTVK